MTSDNPFIVTDLEKELQERLRIAESAMIDLAKRTARLLTENDELRAQVEHQRRQVLRLLKISNPAESISGACNNRMQEILTLQGNLESLIDAAKRQPLQSSTLKRAIAAIDEGQCPPDCAYCNDPYYGHPKPHRAGIDTSAANERAKEERGY